MTGDGDMPALSPRLARCPWCGGAAELNHDNREWRFSDDALWMVTVACPMGCCGAAVFVNVRGPDHAAEAEATAAERWNRRHVGADRRRERQANSDKLSDIGRSETAA